jgi:UDP-glucose 4-epimerase
MMAEAFARSFDLPVVTLRPFNTFGPRQSERALISTLIRQALDPGCESVRVGDTTPVRDLTYVEDTVHAFLAAGSAPNLEFGRAYNAGSQRAVTVAQVIDLVLDLCGSSKPVEQESVRMRPANSEVRALLADSSRFAAATGWAARINLREGLGRTIEWWRNRLAAGQVRRHSHFMT